ncbi:hypothetical protein GCM10010504_51330 [Streptomyces griseus]|uniref:Uncharacterized protein n=1 Tax=Streptomyces albidoflavus TaxID=1886 RepID=A0AA37BY17_9ACTN|nr:hypothetical protein MTP02_27410 [Streptomyces albus]GHF76356.1 hypothetical protein GCM10010504_51330 [Streptomyces griseus]GHI46827.1 hypothetical protein ScoT_30010 [Streptomyces albidoflavus]
MPTAINTAGQLAGAASGGARGQPASPSGSDGAKRATADHATTGSQACCAPNRAAPRAANPVSPAAFQAKKPTVAAFTHPRREQFLARFPLPHDLRLIATEGPCHRSGQRTHPGNRAAADFLMVDLL